MFHNENEIGKNRILRKLILLFFVRIKTVILTIVSWETGTRSIAGNLLIVLLSKCISLERFYQYFYNYQSQLTKSRQCKLAENQITTCLKKSYTKIIIE